MENKQSVEDADLKKSIRDINQEGYLDDSDKEVAGAIRVVPRSEVEGLSDEQRIARAETIERTVDVPTWFKHHKVVIATLNELNSNRDNLVSDPKINEINEALNEHFKPKKFWFVPGATSPRYNGKGLLRGYDIVIRCIDKNKNLVEIKVSTDAVASLEKARGDYYPDFERDIKNIASELAPLGFDYIDGISGNNDTFIQVMDHLLLKIRRKEEEKIKNQNAEDFDF